MKGCSSSPKGSPDPQSKPDAAALLVFVYASSYFIAFGGLQAHMNNPIDCEGFRISRSKLVVFASAALIIFDTCIRG
ncbi:unnamed protein product [Lactuca virosa]|uniref:Uncharacterized protein n=1 Tax=Lactuca virosa TaxID=75947 RepID=A0AAU9NQZ3_9ASTR|nr:unnamed protein product [Lactuca virosa]